MCPGKSFLKVSWRIKSEQQHFTHFILRHERSSPLLALKNVQTFHENTSTHTHCTENLHEAGLLLWLELVMMHKHRFQDAFIWRDLNTYFMSPGDDGLKCAVTGGGRGHADANRTPEVASLSAAKAVADNTQAPLQKISKNKSGRLPSQNSCWSRLVSGRRPRPGSTAALACDRAGIFHKKCFTLTAIGNHTPKECLI